MRDRFGVVAGLGEKVLAIGRYQEPMERGRAGYDGETFELLRVVGWSQVDGD
jgi:hypothetical protein